MHIYGATIQYAKDIDTSTKLGPVDTKFIQQVTGPFLYYARAVDAKMLMALITIASNQAAPTATTMAKRLKFLDYVATHPDAILTYSASNMVPNIHIGGSFLTLVFPTPSSQHHLKKNEKLPILARRCLFWLI